MKQLTLAQQAEFQRYSKKTRREQFLNEMDAVMPWDELFALLEPHYSKGEVGRKPVGLGIMLRVYFLQLWFALSDPAAEDALYESPVLRRFAGIDLPPHGRRPVRGDPDWAALRRQTRRPFSTSAIFLKSTIYAAIHEAAPKAQDMTSRRVKTKAGVDDEQKRKNRVKARVRAKVEWPFRVLKRVFGFTKVRYRGLKKNHEWLCAAFASINIYQHRRRLAKINLRECLPIDRQCGPLKCCEGLRLR
jgi:hypothetical protein